MNKFGNWLEKEKGFVKGIFVKDGERAKFKAWGENDVLSKMGYLFVCYVPAGNETDWEGAIRIGISYTNHPSIEYPLPRCEIKREGQDCVENESFQHTMTIIEKYFSNEEIYEAMFDSSKVLRIEL